MMWMVKVVVHLSSFSLGEIPNPLVSDKGAVKLSQKNNMPHRKRLRDGSVTG
jgi:hypothetical protein